VLGHEVAVEQPQDGLLGDAFREVELVLLERLAFGQPGAINPPFQDSLPTDGDFFADQGGQQCSMEVPLASIAHYLINMTLISNSYLSIQSLRSKREHTPLAAQISAYANRASFFVAELLETRRFAFLFIATNLLELPDGT
jgi:hypothetical protein